MVFLKAFEKRTSGTKTLNMFVLLSNRHCVGKRLASYDFAMKFNRLSCSLRFAIVLGEASSIDIEYYKNQQLYSYVNIGIAISIL